MEPHLLRTHRLSAGEHARLWACPDGRFLFELQSATGRGFTVFVPTMKEAMDCWRRSVGRPQAGDPAEDAGSATPARFAATRSL